MDVFIGPTFRKYYEGAPLVLVDVGASGGVQENWRRVVRHLRIIAFEPDERAYTELIRSADTSSTTCLNVALHREKAVCDFHLAKEVWASSIFKPNWAFLKRFPEAGNYDLVGTIRAPTDTLDNQLRENQIADVDFIKVDTQGSELFILEGAKQALDESVFGLDVEVEFTPLYEGVPLFADVDVFLRKAGFELFDLRLSYWKRTVGRMCGKPKGQLVFGDALYLRGLESFATKLDRCSDDTWKKSKVLRAISICLLYGYLDYALEIFEATARWFPDAERKALTQAIRSEVVLSSRIPNFRGRGRIAAVVERLARILQPKAWATYAKHLGNVE